MDRAVKPTKRGGAHAKQPQQSVYRLAAPFFFLSVGGPYCETIGKRDSEATMKLPRLLCVSVAALTALAGYSQERSASQVIAGPSQSEFVAAYRRAHDARDMDAMHKLYCWDGVTAEIKNITEQYAYNFEDKIIDIKLTSEHPKDRPNQYVKQGVTYGFNLPIALELLVEYPAPTKGAHNTNYYPLGLSDALLGRLTVRLTQPVGGLVGIAGGAFSATLAESVEVNGVTIIPAGAMVQGIVTKEGDYSPQLALNSVTVNGTVRRIETTAITFNQRIEYPAGTELSFKLIRPLNLQK
jgi:hypothetical protein